MVFKVRENSALTLAAASLQGPASVAQQYHIRQSAHHLFRAARTAHVGVDAAASGPHASLILLGSLFLELIFRKGRRTATFQFSESGGSVNGPNLFTELPFCKNPYQTPDSLNCLPPFQ